MPQDHGLGAGHLERVDRVDVAVRAREDDDADPDRHARATAGARRGAALERLDVVRLDQRVRQELARQPLDDRPRRRLVGRRHGQLDPPPDADAGHAVDPEVAEAALDGPALRIEDAGLRA